MFKWLNLRLLEVTRVLWWMIMLSLVLTSSGWASYLFWLACLFESRLGSLEEAMVANDVKIGDLLGKHIVEETLQREQLEEKVNFYEKEFNINPLSWGRKKK